jgi:hypothetical protein
MAVYVFLRSDAPCSRPAKPDTTAFTSDCREGGGCALEAPRPLARGLQRCQASCSERDKGCPGCRVSKHSRKRHVLAFAPSWQWRGKVRYCPKDGLETTVSIISPL